MRRGGQFSGEDIDREPAKQVYKAAPSKSVCIFLHFGHRAQVPTLVPPPTPIPTLGPSIARFTQSLTALTISHSSNTAALTSLAEEREQLDERETELREMVAKVEEKRSWFVDFKEWVEAVATFLDEKVCTILTIFLLWMTEFWLYRSSIRYWRNLKMNTSRSSRSVLI